MAGAGFFVLVLTVDHLLRRDLSPLQHPISDYGRGRYSWVFSLSLVGLAASKAAVGWGLRKSPTAAMRVGAWILVVDAVATTLVALAPTDAGGDPTTLGRIHQAAATTAFLGGTTAFLLVSLPRPGPGIPDAGLAALALTSLLALALFGVAIASGQFVGLTERVHVLATAVWLFVAAYWRLT
jgi:hypothetical membrane protein